MAIDGRRPGREPGRRDSTSLAVGSELVNQPSDETGERPIGDALLLLASP